ncbi:lantibiotic dehydratase [Streptomyces sp. G-G2]|uniref:lantibiotic dehydratase n=1 Tax=Streptomyces sp. G-G2 TaxID=3046201 RepID=UPI0024BA4EC7|nr:lantibiotic dehydratase [Streptomyces sp. G-G2]MDJ0383661.1 lantibiotic dehydratase [Streptomyces sp. G-G2]
MTETYLRGGRWRLWEQFALRGPGFPARGVLRLAPDGLAAAADKFPEGEQLSGERWAEFGALFAEASVESAYALQDIARMPLFREAVAWQNRPVLTSGIAPFLNWTPTAAGRTSMPRQREELVAHYWQRFCVKNDTIGFFGPVGWGRWDLSGAGAEGIAVDPGSGLIADSQVYFASWAVDALAATIGADPALRDWVAPRRVPFVRLSGTEVLVPGRPAQRAAPGTAAVLARCDGVRTAREIAAELPGTDVAAELTELVARRWAVWKLEVPADARPERYLRSWLDRIGDPAARGRALAALDTLERGRERVAAAEGPDALVAALTGLEGEFVALTETAAVREKAAGTAPCRALVYSDCRRSASARLGPAVREAMAPLEPLLTSAGWLTARLAEAVMAKASEVYERLAERGPVDLAAFWFACMPILHGAARSETEELQREFRARWAAILSPPEDARRVRLTLADIAGPVAERFGADAGTGGGEGGGTGVRGGWTAARYLSPDIMIAATGTDAVERGEFELVLGELHMAANTLGSSLFVHQHPDARELTALTDRDHPAPRLMPLLPKEHRSRLSVRTRHALVRPEDYHVALVDFTADPGRPRTVLSADVAVTAGDDGELRVVLPDGAEFAAVDVFAHVLTTLAMDLFQILPDAAEHSPRVTVDRLVVARETWRLPQSGIAFADEKDEARRFVRARQWRESHGLPRFVFVVLPTETRPFYVDFDSPVYLTILAKAVRRLARKEPDGRVVITEMLPSPEQAWLTDDEGRAYTSELRFVAVDEG